MAVPEMSIEQRAAALAKAYAVRRARAAFKDQLSRGEMTLAQALHDADVDDAIGATRVAEVLRALPGIGEVKARQIMTQAHIAPTRRLRGLGTRQRQALLALGLTD